MKILCFGSLNIDYTYRVDHFVQPGETLAAESLQVFSGGKGLNQAIALARAGAETCMAGAVGEDGRFLLEELTAAGVHTDHVSILQQVRTGNAIIQNDKTGDNCILLYGGANRAVTEAQADEVLRHFSAGDWLLLQNEINNLPYIMRRAHERGLRIAFNPSPMEQRVLDFPLEYVDLFLLNRVEAAQLAGTDGAADGLLRGGSADAGRAGRGLCGQRTDHPAGGVSGRGRGYNRGGRHLYRLFPRFAAARRGRAAGDGAGCAGGGNRGHPAGRGAVHPDAGAGRGVRQMKIQQNRGQAPAGPAPAAICLAGKTTGITLVLWWKYINITAAHSDISVSN